MSKFNQATTRPAVGTGPVTTDTRPTGHSYEGAPGYARDAKSELFLLAVANMVGESTFYEGAADRDQRYRDLIGHVACADAEWTLSFLRWLRGEGNMRSASLVGAAEAVKARLDAAKAGREVANGARNRQMVDAVLRRADEPGEILAYWTSRYGRAIPKPVKRGVADAVQRMYDEYNLLKYDTDSHGFRFGDVLDLTHPTPKAPWQGDLFRHAIDRRHGRDETIPESLSTLRANTVARQVASINPSHLLDVNVLREAAMTWEDALSLVGSKVDKRKLWEALIPSMGYMALLRNLRNFDQAGVSDEVAERVAARLADPEQVARSRQFPFRFYAAHNAVASLRWGAALEKALAASLSNVPALSGRTLILVDQSPSMWPGYYTRPVMRDIVNADVAKLFGSALALRAHEATLVGYGHASYRVPFSRGEAVLRLMGKFRQESGTDAYSAARAHFDRHTRIAVVTDGENNGPLRSWADAGVPASVPIYTWNIAGYQYGQDPGGPNRVTFGGMTDAAFRLIPLLEAGRSGSWPWATVV